MKKLLTVLAAVGIVASSATSVVACGSKSDKKPEESKKDIT
ncbi:lipoprotein [Spiroplasma endosymbiont of Atherix ibis]